MWKPIETYPPPKDRIIEAWYKEAGISVAVILVKYPWCNELTLHVCLTGMMEPISNFHTGANHHLDRMQSQIRMTPASISGSKNEPG